jgi:hypothetical protein
MDPSTAASGDSEVGKEGPGKMVFAVFLGIVGLDGVPGVEDGREQPNGGGDCGARGGAVTPMATVAVPSPSTGIGRESSADMDGDRGVVAMGIAAVIPESESP